MQEYDLIILGGGVSGLGVAKLASAHNLKICLIEQAELASGASANSLRIIHGGFRYLQSFDLPRIFESIKAQQLLLKSYPEDIKRLDCLMPLKRFGLQSKLPLTLVTFLYSKLYKLLTNEVIHSSVLASREAELREKILFSKVPYGALYWQDALLINPEKFTTRYVNTFSDTLSILKSKVKTVSRYKNLFEVETESESFRGKVVVNCLGSNINNLKLVKCKTGFDPHWVLAFNLLLKPKLVNKHAIGVRAKDRLLFLTPRDDFSVLGTFYRVLTNNQPATVSTEDIRSAIDSFNSSDLDIKLDPKFVSSTESGLLPAKLGKNKEPILYKREKIHNNSGFVTVLSTKYTTFETQAERVWKQIKKYF